jgi:L-asparaginase
MLEKLLIITTGGTIDKIYFDDKSDYQVGEPQIAGTLDHMHVAFEYEMKTLMRKDSLHMTEEDRDRIRGAIEDSDAKYILITHGTDSMVDTARNLQDLGDRRIVITGALFPARFRDSDAVFNIGCAIGAVQCVDPGVWIIMNGKVWNPDTVVKNVAKNRFEAVD